MFDRNIKIKVYSTTLEEWVEISVPASTPEGNFRALAEAEIAKLEKAREMLETPETPELVEQSTTPLEDRDKWIRDQSVCHVRIRRSTFELELIVFSAI